MVRVRSGLSARKPLMLVSVAFSSSTRNFSSLSGVIRLGTGEWSYSQRSTMPATTIKKVEVSTSPRGEMGQKYLVAGKRVSMRLWVQEPGRKPKAPTTRDYETVGYVISGSARLDLEGQTLSLKPGDSWLVPAGAMHQYTIIEPFTAVEATAPPAEVHGRDAPT